MNKEGKRKTGIEVGCTKTGKWGKPVTVLQIEIWKNIYIYIYIWMVIRVSFDRSVQE